MARKSFAELSTELDTLINTNGTGEVTAADVRSWLSMLLDTLRPVYGVLSAAVRSQTFGITSAKVLFDTAYSSKADEISVIAGAASNMDLADRGSVTGEFNADITLPNNVSLTFTLFKNAAATAWKVTGVGRGNGNPVSVSMTFVDYSDPAATYDIRAVCENAGVSVTLENMVLLAKISPVNSYT